MRCAWWECAVSLFARLDAPSSSSWRSAAADSSDSVEVADLGGEAAAAMCGAFSTALASGDRVARAVGCLAAEVMAAEPPGGCAASRNACCGDSCCGVRACWTCCGFCIG